MAGGVREGPAGPDLFSRCGPYEAGVTAFGDGPSGWSFPASRNDISVTSNSCSMQAPSHRPEEGHERRATPRRDDRRRLRGHHRRATDQPHDEGRCSGTWRSSASRPPPTTRSGWSCSAVRQPGLLHRPLRRRDHPAVPGGRTGAAARRDHRLPPHVRALPHDAQGHDRRDRRPGRRRRQRAGRPPATCASAPWAARSSTRWRCRSGSSPVAPAPSGSPACVGRGGRWRSSWAASTSTPRRPSGGAT